MRSAAKQGRQAGALSAGRLVSLTQHVQTDLHLLYVHAVCDEYGHRLLSLQASCISARKFDGSTTDSLPKHFL